MKLLLHALLVMVMSSAYAQSSLPVCQGKELENWNNCFGRYEYDNGTIYVGDFNNNAPHGYGSMTNPNGNKFIGNWINGYRSGTGIQTYTDNRPPQDGVWKRDLFLGRNASEIADQNKISKESNFLPSTSNVTQAVLVPPKDKRIALVIGNSSYKIRPLLNPRNDADDVSKVLRSTGFDVIDVRDASLSQMRNAVRQFGDRLLNHNVGLVYYSGHGIEVRGRNYFVPVNADIKRSDEVADQSLDVNLILEKMETAKKGVNILIIDACRDDPFGGSFRSSSRGLASMDAPQGTIVAFSTSPGKVAADGEGRNSPYTKNLVKSIQTPNLPIEQVFKQVRRAVQQETKNQQTPWENTSLSGDFYFSVKK